MLPPSWQLKTPLDAIIFDCDGTLSAIEGIDELAEKNGAGNAVRALTAEAMGKTGINLELYRQRLNLILPVKEQVLSLAPLYLKYLTKDTDAVIHTLQRLGKEIYIISAGLLPAVMKFGEALHVPRANIFAVDIQFDAQGKFLDFDHTSPLTNNQGKRILVSELMQKYARTAYVGDGLNDVAVYDLVTRFIGYGGHYYRANIAKMCEFYIEQATMAPILPLVLTQDEYEKLTTTEKELYQLGLKICQSKNI